MYSIGFLLHATKREWKSALKNEMLRISRNPGQGMLQAPSILVSWYSQVTEDGTRRLIHGLVKQTYFCAWDGVHGGTRLSWILKLVFSYYLFSGKMFSLSFELVKWNFTTVVPHGKMLLAAAWKKTYCLLPEKKLIAPLEKNLLPPTWKKTYCLPPGKKLIASHLEKSLLPPPWKKLIASPLEKNLLPPTWKKTYCLPPGKNPSDAHGSAWALSLCGDKTLSNTTKLSVFKSVFTPILTYGQEFWVMSDKVLSPVQAVEKGFCEEFTAWHFTTKCAVVKFGNPRG